MLIQADARHIPLADKSCHMVCTSPPYWSLRDYGLPPSIFGGGPLCEHVWGNERLQREAAGFERMNWTTGGDPAAKVKAGPVSQGSFCSLCGAWRGCLGLEPTPELYVAHMVEVFREVWRVLRDDGVCFLNLGDSYYGSGKGLYGDGTSHGTEGVKQKTNQGSIGVPRVASYGTSGKALADSQDRGCLCGSLCDVCRVAYHHKSHSDGLLVAMLTASLSVPNLEHMESVRGHLPTSDSVSQKNRNSPATQDQGHSLSLVDERLRDSLVSTLGESSPQLLDVCLQRDSRDECLLCGRSLADGVLVSECKRACPVCSQTSSVSKSDRHASTGDNAETDGSLASHKVGTAYDLAYPDYTMPSRHCQLKPKDLVGIPWRVAFALQADGWWLRSDIIWAKSNPMPESVTDRPTKSHEYLFLLSKSARYFYDAEAIKEASTGHGGLHTFGAQVKGNVRNDGGRALHRDEMPTHNRRTVWTIPTRPYSGAHFATYPPALVEPCILAGTSAKGACPVCGGPWERVTEKATEGIPHYKSKTEGCDYAQYGESTTTTLRANVRTSTTTGWRPTCDCGDDVPCETCGCAGIVYEGGAELACPDCLGAGINIKPPEPVPCLVLDPFAGSGTTGMVAIKHGRDFVGLDLSGEYLSNLATKRLSKIQKALL